MKRITVNGEEIPESAIAFELARLTRFYLEHGISEDEIKKSASLLRDRAIDQAIGAKLSPTCFIFPTVSAITI